MDINKLGDQLVACIAVGLTNKYPSVCDNLRGEGLYSYVLYCASGFYAMCIASSTKKSLDNVREKIRKAEVEVLESLSGHADLLEMFMLRSELYAEIAACEWEYIYTDVPEFQDLDSVVSEIYEYSYEYADESFNVSKFLTDRVIEAIENFKRSSTFDLKLLTGLQFADPSENEILIVEDVSKQTNLEQWHEKVMKLHRAQ